MKVLTWNMACRRRLFSEAWDFLINEINPDVALLQEVNLPDWAKGENILFTSIGGTRNWGSAIYTKNLPINHIPFESHRGWVMVGDLSINGHSDLTVVSVHSEIIKNYVFPNLTNIFDGLSLLLEGKKFIVGGDLNSCRLIDKVYGIKHHGAFFDKIESGNFFNCHRKFYAEEQQTFWGRTDNPYQDDHLFASKNLSDQVLSCEILTNEQTRKFSDHSPVITEILI